MIISEKIQQRDITVDANGKEKKRKKKDIKEDELCRVEVGLTNTEVMKSNVVRSVQQKIGTAFYREYLRRMLDLLPELIEELKEDDTEHAPDILLYSSQATTQHRLRRLLQIKRCRLFRLIQKYRMTIILS